MPAKEKLCIFFGGGDSYYNFNYEAKIGIYASHGIWISKNQLPGVVFGGKKAPLHYD